jgi:hypothetical protein
VLRQDGRSGEADRRSQASHRVTGGRPTGNDVAVTYRACQN